MQRERLAVAVKSRREHLGISVSAAARAAGIHRATWTGLEAATKETERYIYGPIERVLRWEPGSIDAIVGGGEPTALPEPTRPLPGLAHDEPLALLDLPHELRRILRMDRPDNIKLAMIARLLDLHDHAQRAHDPPNTLLLSA